ncbi:hypothetical protein CQA53_10845 [Helicobacter didelphidarum]|uniref:Uncharacterized protein n=1 Tax=Helicobacter didelphidarum TaxID=2040648 RepID=A0A3D8I768_9HELI|nr:hypothetical protein [Helicobacter didelphidarum]RDU60584.1 hypothetical protein CQA53_10845 [Helicobacter didelphidarum]
MNNKFSFSKFVVDCIISFGVMVVSTIVLFMPIGIIVGMIYSLFEKLFYINFNINGIYQYPLIIFICNTIILFLFFYIKKNPFAKINKASLVFCYAILTTFWWKLAYNLAHGYIY